MKVSIYLGTLGFRLGIFALKGSYILMQIVSKALYGTILLAVIGQALGVGINFAYTLSNGHIFWKNLRKHYEDTMVYIPQHNSVEGEFNTNIKKDSILRIYSCSSGKWLSITKGWIECKGKNILEASRFEVEVFTHDEGNKKFKLRLFGDDESKVCTNITGYWVCIKNVSNWIRIEDCGTEDNPCCYLKIHKYYMGAYINNSDIFVSCEKSKSNRESFLIFVEGFI